MYLYKYTAKQMDGTVVKGSVQAESQPAFYAEIRRRGLFCTAFTEEPAPVKARAYRRMGTKAMVVFCRKFGTMLHSGLSITAALEVLYTSAEKPRWKAVFLELYESIQTGMALSAAMRAQGRTFSAFTLSMVEAGEESGALDAILLRLAAHFEKENKLNASIRMAVTYPVILVVFSFAVILVLFTFVMPSLFTLFSGYELPPLTRFMMDLSDFFVRYWWAVLLGIALLAPLVARSGHIPGVRYALSYLRWKAPVVGKFSRMVYTARLSRSIALLYGSGVSLITTLSISCTVLGNEYVTRAFRAVTDAVLAGRPLSESLQKTGLFDAMLISMVRVGEESGRMEEVLGHTAEYYDSESDVAVMRMVSMLEPVLLLVLGVIIGLVLASVIVPMYSMMQTIGQ